MTRASALVFLLGVVLFTFADCQEMVEIKSDALNNLEALYEADEEHIEASKSTFLGALKGGCMAKGFYYENDGSARLIAAGPVECQAMCQNGFNCVHFTYWPDGGCHISSSTNAVLHDGNKECEDKTGHGSHVDCAGKGAVAGSRECGSEFVDLYPSSSPGATAEISQAVRAEMARKKKEIKEEKAMSGDYSSLEHKQEEEESVLKTDQAELAKLMSEVPGSDGSRNQHAKHISSAMMGLGKHEELIMGAVALLLVTAASVFALFLGGCIGDSLSWGKSSKSRKHKKQKSRGMRVFEELPQEENDCEAGLDGEAGVPNANDWMQADVSLPPASAAGLAVPGLDMPLMDTNYSQLPQMQAEYGMPTMFNLPGDGNNQFPVMSAPPALVRVAPPVYFQRLPAPAVSPSLDAPPPVATAGSAPVFSGQHGPMLV